MNYDSSFLFFLLNPQCLPCHTSNSWPHIFTNYNCIHICIHLHIHILKYNCSVHIMFSRLTIGAGPPISIVFPMEDHLSCSWASSNACGYLCNVETSFYWMSWKILWLLKVLVYVQAFSQNPPVLYSYLKHLNTMSKIVMALQLSCKRLTQSLEGNMNMCIGLLTVLSVLVALAFSVISLNISRLCMWKATC